MSYPSNEKKFTVTTDELLADIEAAEDTAKHVSEASGDHRSNVKALLERGYEKATFAWFRKQHALSDEKFADRWRTLKACMDAYDPVAEARIRDLVDRMGEDTDGMAADMAAE